MSALNLPTMAASALKATPSGNERIGFGDPSTGDSGASTIAQILSPVVLKSAVPASAAYLGTDANRNFVAVTAPTANSGTTPKRVSVANSFTLLQTDSNGFVFSLTAGGCTVTLPVLADQTTATVVQSGAGTVTFVAGSGVAIVANPYGASSSTARRGARITITYLDSATVSLGGELTGAGTSTPASDGTMTVNTPA